MDRIGLICRYIKEDPRSTQRDLAQKTGFSVGTVNTLIKEAMQKRLIAQGKSVAGTYELTGAGDDFLEQFKVDGALIIAAGFGSRFVPLTFETPKGLLEVFGERMIERQIRQLHEVGITDITIAVGYLKGAGGQKHVHPFFRQLAAGQYVSRLRVWCLVCFFLYGGGYVGMVSFL